MTIPASQWSAPWTTDDRCTVHQAGFAEPDLSAWLSGKPQVAFDAFRKLIVPILGEFKTLLEVGCGCGYYFKVLEHIDRTKHYYGCDISPHMLFYACQLYDLEGKRFFPSKAEKILKPDASFDVVCPSAVIQHMPDYRPAIREAIRVSRRYVLLHRVEATSLNTFELLNPAYETELPTRIINENELLTFCGLNGLTLRQQEKWGVGGTRFNVSYLMEKA